MTKTAPARAIQLLLGASAGILALGAVMHARAFSKVAAAVASSTLPEFYGNSLKALWLIDSATLLVVASVFALVAARVTHVSGLGIVLVAVIPGATSAFLYAFMGFFLPAHMLLVAAAAASVAGILACRRTSG